MERWDARARCAYLPSFAHSAGCIAAVYDISSNRLTLASSSKQSSGLHYTRGLEGNRFHNGIGRYIGLGKRAAKRRFADQDRISAWGSLALWNCTATAVIGTWAHNIA
jgi:hypothetical protein